MNRQPPTPERARDSVLRQLALLPTLTLEQLRAKWRELYGFEPPRYQRQLLIKRLAYRLQALCHGGLSAATQAQLDQLAAADPLTRPANQRPAPTGQAVALPPGTRLIRLWHEQPHEVIVQADGFDYAGRRFQSLSAVAREITGTRWNGPVFFGLKQSGDGHAR